MSLNKVITITMAFTGCKFHMLELQHLHHYVADHDTLSSQCCQLYALEVAYKTMED